MVVEKVLEALRHLDPDLLVLVTDCIGPLVMVVEKVLEALRHLDSDLLVLVTDCIGPLVMVVEKVLEALGHLDPASLSPFPLLPFPRPWWLLAAIGLYELLR